MQSQVALRAAADEPEFLQSFEGDSDRRALGRHALGDDLLRDAERNNDVVRAA